VADQKSKGDIYTEVDFERVVDEPLKRGQSTDHEDRGRQTVPQLTEADPTVYPADGLTRAARPTYRSTVRYDTTIRSR
jgi:hypothetical protein